MVGFGCDGASASNIQQIQHDGRQNWTSYTVKRSQATSGCDMLFGTSNRTSLQGCHEGVKDVCKSVDAGVGTVCFLPKVKEPKKKK